MPQRRKRKRSDLDAFESEEIDRECRRKVLRPCPRTNRKTKKQQNSDYVTTSEKHNIQKQRQGDVVITLRETDTGSVFVLAI